MFLNLVFSAIRRALQRRASHRQLASLDARMLADVGLLRLPGGEYRRFTRDVPRD